MCDITLQGTVCTDSYNSLNGAYNNPNPDCVSVGGAGTNAFASGAGVGSGGQVTLSGASYTVNGDVSYGADPPSYSALWACSTSSSGVTGSVSGVTGTVQPVPAIPEPPMPTFTNCSWYGGAVGTSCSKNLTYAIPPDPTNVGNGDYVWVKQVSGVWYYEASISGTTTDYLISYPGWNATTKYTSGTIVNPGNGHAYTCTVTGTSATTPPAWPTTSGGTVSDGGSWSAWAPITAYTAGQMAKATPDNGHVYKCTVAGTSGTTQPAFPTGAGATVNEPAYPTWAALTAYTTTSIIAENGHWYQPTVAGRSGASAPAWPTGSGATVVDNAYNGWVASQAQALGNVIHPAGTTHLYTCVNPLSGNKKTGAAPPVWPTGAGATVVDNNVTWQEYGSSNGVTWQEKGILAVVTWQEVGPSSAITWTESGTSTNVLGGGTASDPFRLPEITVGTNGSVCLTGSSTPDAPIYYEIKNLDTQGTMYIANVDSPPSSCPATGYTGFGYAVFNVYQELSVGGQGIANGGMPPAAPPAALVINVYNEGSNDLADDSVTFTGQANVAAVITALGGAKLAGSGAGGAFWGSILAGRVTDAGKYAVHYDKSLQVLSGKLMPLTIRNYNRPRH